MWCTRWYIPLLLLPFPTAPSYFLFVFLFSMTMHARPCLYCVVLLSALFTSSCLWEPVSTSYLLQKYENVAITILSDSKSANERTLDLAPLKAEVASGKTSLTRMVDRCWCNSGYSLVETTASPKRYKFDRPGSSQTSELTPPVDTALYTKTLEADAVGTNYPSTNPLSERSFGRPRDSLTYFRSLFDPYNTTVWEIHSLIMHAKRAQDKVEREAALSKIQADAAAITNSANMTNSATDSEGKTKPGSLGNARGIATTPTRWQRLYSALTNQESSGNNENSASEKVLDGQRESSLWWMRFPSPFSKKSDVRRPTETPSTGAKNAQLSADPNLPGNDDIVQKLDAAVTAESNIGSKSWWRIVTGMFPSRAGGDETRHEQTLYAGKKGDEIESGNDGPKADPKISGFNVAPHHTEFHNPTLPHFHTDTLENSASTTAITKSKPISAYQTSTPKPHHLWRTDLPPVQRAYLVMWSLISILTSFLNPLNLARIGGKTLIISLSWLIRNVNRQAVGNFLTKDHDLRQFGIGAVVDFRWGR